MDNFYSDRAEAYRQFLISKKLAMQGQDPLPESPSHESAESASQEREESEKQASIYRVISYQSSSSNYKG